MRTVHASQDSLCRRPQRLHLCDSGDDVAELYLSTDGTSSNKALIMTCRRPQVSATGTAAFAAVRGSARWLKASATTWVCTKHRQRPLERRLEAALATRPSAWCRAARWRSRG